MSTIAACDDPLKPRAAPPVTQLGLFALVDPDQFTLPVLVQQAQGELLALDAVVRSGAATIAQASVPPVAYFNELFEELRPCLHRYRQSAPHTSPWIARCVELAVRPQYATAYEVEISAPGRPSVRASTTVPGDFEIVSHTLTRLESGDVRLEATWQSSAQSYRYLVSVIGMPWGMPAVCTPDSSCHDRWFTVTTDTSISTVIPARHFVDMDTLGTLPLGIAIYALNRELHGYLLSGVTSNFFPVPPAQNAVGGMGAAGSWVRRAETTADGITLERVGAGMKVTNSRATAFAFELVNGSSNQPYQRCPSASRPACPRLDPGETVLVPYSEIVNLGPTPRSSSLLLFVYADGQPTEIITSYLF